MRKATKHTLPRIIPALLLGLATLAAPALQGRPSDPTTATPRGTATTPPSSGTTAAPQGEHVLRLPQFFGSGMVVQRGKPIPVWGWGTPGDRVTVTLGGRKATATVAADGTWRVRLAALPAGGPHELAVMARWKGSSSAAGPAFLRRSLTDVLVGDVFLCSGQSNMELPVRRCMDIVSGLVGDYTSHQVRYLKLPQQYNYVRPNDDARALPWQDLTPQNCGEVSAICYFMARHLQEHTQVPVGIVNSSVGGTRVEAWMPQAVLQGFDRYRDEFAHRRYHQADWPDSIRREENRAAGEWDRQMARTDTVAPRWRHDDPAAPVDWRPVAMFSNWSALPAADGTAAPASAPHRNGSFWFRTAATLPDSLAGRPGLLRFGAMKDADSVFVNGHFVGTTSYQYPPRLYPVPAGILRPGANDITVHLISQSGRPGFVPDKLYQLEVGDHVFTLPDTLLMAVGSVMPQRPATTYFVDTPTGLYNAMIAPLRDIPFRGILWYQGESNLRHPADYADLLAAMVQAWRDQFRQPGLPIVIMQLPGYMSRHADRPLWESDWTQIRQQQLRASQRIPHAALAPTLDTGEAVDIHPQDKQVAGLRAALQMRRLAYGERDLVAGGPTPLRADIAGGQALITFDPATGTLAPRPQADPDPAAAFRYPEAPLPAAQATAPLTGFAIRLADGTWQAAQATITGPHTLAIPLPDGLTATCIRYCWDDFPQTTLYNTHGIPSPQWDIEASRHGE